VTRVAVVGAGGVGTVLAAALHDAGQEVVVCARSSVGPMRLHRDGMTRRLDVPVVREPGEVTPAEWVLLCTKAQDTASAQPWMARLCGPGTVVVACQNGIDHRQRVSEVAGPATVLPALVYIAAERTEPGLVRHRRGRSVVVPDEPAGHRFVELAAPGVDVQTTDDFVTAAWRKLLTNVAANPITALTGRRVGVLADAEVRTLAAAVLAEAVAVGRAEGARLGPEDIEKTFGFFAGFGPEDGTSMLYDRLAGRPLEHEQLNGALAVLGRRHGIPTPANQALYALLGALGPAISHDGRDR
jgi:2-dehydropantoate 2-reductase